MFLLPMARHETQDIHNAPLPSGYVHHLTHPAFLTREIRGHRGFRLVREDATPGITWRFGPLRIERVIGDAEPIASPDGPLRIVTWQRIMRKDAPAGWKESRLVMRTSRSGFATVEDNWKAQWSTHARRHYKTWQRSEWEILPISADEYIAAFRRSPMDAFLKLIFTNLLQQKIRGHGEHVHIIGARKKAPHAPIEAGFVFLDVPEIHQSIHLLSFHNEAAKVVSAGVGLIDDWFQHAHTHNIRFLEFGCFWTPGEPSSWKGFSRFKSQFGLQYIDYPRPLAQWMGRVGG